MANKNKAPDRVVSVNRKAYHDYEILETFECGISLTGTEVKSIRGGQVNLRDNYAQVESGEIWVYRMHISPYTHGNIMNHDPVRPRKLLLHKREIRRLIGKIQEKGLTLVVTKLYWNRNWLKVELGLARGKKLFDKRHALQERDIKRQIERAVRRDA
ncbi:SsrA-binding protein [bacterium (Candidatus Blackallbacteria) CG17_big_fil_post_rev_8_21_14_2_50_48_46]|uniref:SsrA-binding protein n=1 Tax=bacterium (Candidatus Blackallbacteria) CG17_big_fil_post_rev_8_21_14_2_50_48_46 TaxID=2014261 RepID=A0A2M7G9J9_9BACT|nr:MAG: SsrA-binding protein [bacterium (Candidatus Blackallbacteria) CG18_big_fil_WC_8_21_14_2_50_49_26]PIW18721.1 MAG: SsrA-binding protein [bacterium (Candidatus Blackallbacteria) CG17_big_fil_post_rev_8_21_14_2_50_48_46]PIW50576.1 MAG: SsrA-binding protein [bacterium (Candidatus Blackallbacteria) CG13_big_fil_rev_8_21_14_2_50_49_14]